MSLKKKIKFLHQLIFNLVISSGISLLLLIGRIIFITDWAFNFIAWNLILAWVPLLLAYWLKFNLTKKSVYYQAAIFLLWLLFLPNAPYLITDFIHLTTWYRVPLWYDIVLFTSFAWNGLILGFVSLFLTEEFLKKIMTVKKAEILINFSLVLACFGIYFGRYMRHNSWDILSQPILVAGDLANSLLDKTNLLNMAGMTFAWFLFLLGGYKLFRLLLTNKKIN
ncbi:MAG: DUF1361 domain-containing protein [Candidatus Magasanikbacteria bacterium]|nr:DUF1361 domain-containing protein [Candidatus Magasanikbacteria bacterium]